MSAVAIPENIEFMIYYGVNSDDLFGLINEAFVINQYNITEKEREKGIKPGYLCVSTNHAAMMEIDVLDYSNFVGTLVEGMGSPVRYYYFRPVKHR